MFLFHNMYTFELANIIYHTKLQTNFTNIEASFNNFLNIQ